MKSSIEYLEYIVNEIHTTIAATVDENGLPVTCVIDMMYCDEKGLYFLTAKGKNFYHRLKDKEYLSLSCFKGEDTMHSVSVSIRGKVREIGSEMLSVLFEHNPYMNEIYPTEHSQQALTVFCIYEGNGEWFDLSKKPIERDRFTFGNSTEIQNGYFIDESCISCGACLDVCPQNCIDISDKAVIRENNCLHCGNCMNICPANAVKKR